MIRKIRSSLILALVLGLGMAATSPAWAISDAQKLVVKAKWTLDNMIKNQDFGSFRETLPKAKGVMIFPAIIKGAFIFGGEGGNGVLLGRTGKGNWSYPAFFTLGAASFGLQIGGEIKEVVLLLMSTRAVKAVIANEVKLGADLSVTAGPVGVGVEGSTTTAAGADIIAFAFSKGAFAGISVEGAVIHERSSLNGSYYKSGATARQIVIQRKWKNRGAEGLRRSLSRY